MKSVTLLTLAIATISGQAIAQEECKTIEDDTKRLSCYDIAFGVSQITSGPVEGIGKWNKTVDVSPLTDDKNVYLSLLSDDLVRGRFSSAGPATLFLRCKENTTSAFFVFNDQHVAVVASAGTLLVRIDVGL